MANLAIKGHASRGNEVIEILEMLGGKNHDRHNGSLEWTYSIDMSRYACYYYIDGDGNIECSHNVGIPLPGIHFTLEEFLKKFPYKVGDSVSSKYLKNYKIEKAEWVSRGNRVIYKLQGVGWHSVEDLQPYKEAPMYLSNSANKQAEEIEEILEPVKEIMEEIDIMNHTTEINLNHPCFKGCNEIEIIIPDGWEFKQRDNKMFGVRKQPKYPKTYKECCEALGLSTMDNDAKGYKAYLIIRFQELLIARDAYWKIAGEEMGLGKPWEPPYGCEPVEIFCVHTYQNRITRISDNSSYHHILAFPTAEMRDVFYENFKDLIESCKEFL